MSSYHAGTVRSMPARNASADGMESKASVTGFGVAAVMVSAKSPFGAIVPGADGPQNLAVPVCASATHVAYSSIRLETTWMALGQAAGVAAALGARGDRPLAQVDVGDLRRAMPDVLHLEELPRA